MDSGGSRSPRLTVLVGLILLLIVYGSLFPFRWDFAQPQPFVWHGPIGVLDLIENVVLFLPLGAVLGWSAQGRARHAARFVAWALMALGLAGALQWLQIYLPRTPALYDVIFNLLGHGLGWGGGVLARRRLGHLLARHPTLEDADRFTLVLIALWLLAELYPLLPTLDVSSVKENIKSLWQQELWQPRRLAIHAGMTVIGLAAVVELARSAHLAHRARQAAWLAATGVLAGKFFVVGQSPGVPVVAGIASGALLWRLLDRAPPLRWTSTASVALVTYLIVALWPWAWRTPPADMAWMPFASSLSTAIQSSLPARALECLCFGAILWGTVRRGARLVTVTLCTALLAFVCEWTQRYLPTRTAEITPLLLALGMGWLLTVAATPSYRRMARTSSSTGNRPTATIATDGNAASARRSSRARL